VQFNEKKKKHIYQFTEVNREEAHQRKQRERYQKEKSRHEKQQQA
jgi:hypothetical protein